MTTFQTLIEGFLQALDHLLPISNSFSHSFFNDLLHWPAPSPELDLLILLMASLVFLIHFRFDWLGLFSAFLKCIFNPKSLHPERRTLDQHSLLFLMIVFLPQFLLRLLLSHSSESVEWIQHPFLAAGLTGVLAFLFHSSYRWNKRIHGLNHLRLSHGTLLSILCIPSAHPALPLIGLLWIGFAFCNYHFEAIFKYSMLLLGLALFAETGALFATTSIHGALEQIGHLNSVAVLVVAFSIFWIGLENLEKTLSENTYKNFLWLNTAIAVYLFASHFIPKP
jgi:undecaprenyl pyrophosphate phosphatase UppP